LRFSRGLAEGQKDKKRNHNNNLIFINFIPSFRHVITFNYVRLGRILDEILALSLISGVIKVYYETCTELCRNGQEMPTLAVQID
jgi:hypothetical protein